MSEGKLKINSKNSTEEKLRRESFEKTIEKIWRKL